MKFDHVEVSLPKDTVYYAVEILVDQDSPLKLDTVWDDKKEAIKRGVEANRMFNRCVFISTIEEGKFVETEIL